VFQEATLLPWKNALENAAFLLITADETIKRREAFERAAAMLRLVGLDDADKKMPSQLSGGMRQRVAICRALVQDPGLLLMDEPFGALDAMTREAMNMELMRVWSEERKTVIFITHSIPEAVLLGDRVVVMSPRPGRISEVIDVDVGRPRTLRTMAMPRFGELCDRIRTIFGAQSMTATSL
jgi:NitT/TauT family transport system ATP-binding protein